MANSIQRRDVIRLAAAAATLPLAAQAQQPALPVVGYLDAGEPISVVPFRKGLSETGFVEGRNMTIEYRFARNANDQLPELAADLVGRHVAVILAVGLRAALAAKAATTTIPIVFRTGNDPVQYGLVASFNRPGGNITGINSIGEELGPKKRLGLLHDLLPGASRFAILVNPNPSSSESVITGFRAAAATIGGSIEVATASTDREIDTAFASLAQKRIDALLIGAQTLFFNRRVQLVHLASYYRLPAMYPGREFTEIGGLASYGRNSADGETQAGIYAGRILKGEKPADLPVMRPVKFEFILNLQTARLLGIEVPETLLATADEVIE